MNKKCPKCGYPQGPENETAVEYFVRTGNFPGSGLARVVTSVIIGLLIGVVVATIGN